MGYGDQFEMDIGGQKQDKTNINYPLVAISS